MSRASAARLSHAALLGVMLVAGSGTAGPAAAAAATHALVIGIDRYDHAPDLQGAVADARDIAAALRATGAVAVTVLLDGDATRSGVLGAWRQLVDNAGPDDVLVLAFAGHGIQVPDPDGDEADGFDEAFVLPAFRPGGRDDANLLLDDEIDGLLRGAAPRTVVFVADSCHSGTASRAVDPRADFRAARFLPRSAYGETRRARGVSPSAAVESVREIEAEGAGNVVFLGAVPEMFEVHEVLIDGAARGALSWAVARAVEGRADADGDRTVATGELRDYVGEAVRAVAENRQEPQIWAGPDPSAALFAVAGPPPAWSLAGDGAAPATPPPGGPGSLQTWGAAATPAEPARPWGGATAPAGSAQTWGTPAAAPAEPGPVRIAVAGPDAAEGGPAVARLRGVFVVDDPTRADLVWHLPSGDVLTSAGDVAARLGLARDPPVLQGVVDKWRVVRALHAAPDGTLRTTLEPHDGLHRGGERMALGVASDRPGRLVLFDLAADGSVLLVLPRPGQEPPVLAPGEPLAVPLRAGPPFGADHLVAVRVDTAGDAASLAGLLRAAHGRPLDAGAADELVRRLRGAAVTPTGIYTAP